MSSQLHQTGMLSDPSPTDIFWRRVAVKLDRFCDKAEGFAAQEPDQWQPAPFFLAFPDFGGKAKKGPQTILFETAHTHCFRA